MKKLPLVAALLSPALQAGTMGPATTPNMWHYEIAPYLWASGLKGDVTARDRTAHFAITFKDILAQLQFAVQGHLEAGYGPLSLMVDPTYIKIAQKNLTSKTTLIDSGVFYRFYQFTTQNNQQVSFELLGGDRYYNVSNALEFPAFDLTVSSAAGVNAPIVGGRIKYHLTPTTQAWLKGDVGGFHVDNMKSTWSATLGLAYAVKPNIDLGLAYRVLKIDFLKGNSAMDVLMYGPMIGVNFHD